LTKRTKPDEQGKLQSIDVEILEGLALYGPRNKSKLAVQLGMPLGTLRHRINYLRSHFSMRLLGSIYHTNIGLRKVVTFAEAKPGYEDLLYQCLKANDYWLYLSQCVGTPKCLAIFGIPAGKEKEFEEFISKIQQLETVDNVKFTWSTCFQNVNPTSVWFDKTSEEWVFPWESWLQEIQTKRRELPYTLKDPDKYAQTADWIDIVILKELEKNSAVKLKDIARKLGTSLQRVKYHFENHVIRGKMFEGHQIIAEHYKALSAETYYFRFDFGDYGSFAGFANSLLNKPFARAMGKAYQKNQLFAQIYLPRQQLRGFIEALSKLVRSGFMKTYEYVIQDLTQTERQTISYEYFKDDNWTYDHKKYLERLQVTTEQLVKTA
jgi:DNA-binding Lrp family transcriptional regulator